MSPETYTYSCGEAVPVEVGYKPCCIVNGERYLGKVREGKVIECDEIIAIDLTQTFESKLTDLREQFGNSNSANTLMNYVDGIMMLRLIESLRKLIK